MIRIVIDHDRIGIPEPVVDIRIVIRRNTEIETIEPESLAIPSPQPEDMAASEPAGKTPMFPGTIQMVMRIIAAGIVPDPLVVRVNVRSLRMSCFVRKLTMSGTLIRGRMRNLYIASGLLLAGLAGYLYSCFCCLLWQEHGSMP